VVVNAESPPVALVVALLVALLSVMIAVVCCYKSSSASGEKTATVLAEGDPPELRSKDNDAQDPELAHLDRGDSGATVKLHKTTGDTYYTERPGPTQSRPRVKPRAIRTAAGAETEQRALAQA
jgi:hypothetical protein